MKIIVWQNCQVVQEIEIPDAPGPDIALDPWNMLVSIRRPGNGNYSFSYTHVVVEDD